jgi:hypothetical protein
VISNVNGLGSSGPSNSQRTNPNTDSPTANIPSSLRALIWNAGDESRAPTDLGIRISEEVKQATRQIFPGIEVKIPDMPQGQGAFGSVYNFKVSGETNRLKVISPTVLEPLAQIPSEVFPKDENLPDLTVELAALRQGHPQTPKLLGVIVDTPREGEAQNVVGVVSSWVEGPNLREALEQGIITPGEAKILLSELVDSLAASGMYDQDSILGNFIVRDCGPKSMKKELVLIDCGMVKLAPADDLEQKTHAKRILELTVDQYLATVPQPPAR